MIHTLARHVLHIPFVAWVSEYTQHLRVSDCIGLAMLSVLIWWGVTHEKYASPNVIMPQAILFLILLLVITTGLGL